MATGGRSRLRCVRALSCLAVGAVGAVVGTWTVGVHAAAPASAPSHALRRELRLAPALARAVTVPMTRSAVLSVLTPVGGGGLQLYSGPDAPAPAASLPATDELGSPLVLLGVARQGDWLEALLPTRPNGSTGWVRSSDVTTSAPPYEVSVSLAAHQLRLVRISDGAVVLTSTVGIGAPETPTPPGEYFVRDLFPTHTMDHPYGPFAFGLSGHSDVLMHFGTGDGRIAIHGTNQPATIGADLSAGCVHVPNDVDLALIPYLTLGTPVVIG
jgi:lipoprotein-anchoring transpeptidase ErfK/SrfK